MVKRRTQIGIGLLVIVLIGFGSFFAFFQQTVFFSGEKCDVFSQEFTRPDSAEDACDEMKAQGFDCAVLVLDLLEAGFPIDATVYLACGNSQDSDFDTCAAGKIAGSQTCRNGNVQTQFINSDCSTTWEDFERCTNAEECINADCVTKTVQKVCYECVGDALTFEEQSLPATNQNCLDGLSNTILDCTQQTVKKGVIVDRDDPLSEGEFDFMVWVREGNNCVEKTFAAVKDSKLISYSTKSKCERAITIEESGGIPVCATNNDCGEGELCVKQQCIAKEDIQSIFTENNAIILIIFGAATAVALGLIFLTKRKKK